MHNSDPIRETIVPLEGSWMFVRHTVISRSRPTILFVHGIGESGLSFTECFSAVGLRGFNLIVPDLLGYGRSTSALNDDYSFASQISRLLEVMRQLQVNEFFLVGHSMGGDVATIMASSDREKLSERIVGLINVEGDLTSHDLFISNCAIAAAAEGRFLQWFTEEFSYETVFKNLGDKRESCRRYYASLRFSRSEAFLASAQEIIAITQLNAKKLTVIADLFHQVRTRKIFCWGSTSLALETKRFLEENGVPNRGFQGAGHWVMIDKSAEFYSFLGHFVRGNNQRRSLSV